MSAGTRNKIGYHRSEFVASVRLEHHSAWAAASKGCLSTFQEQPIGFASSALRTVFQCAIPGESRGRKGLFGSHLRSISEE